MQIYKITWLKLNDIQFDQNNFEDKFNLNSNFEILSKGCATGLAGLLNSASIDEWVDKKIVGLFDFDDEGLGCFKDSKNRNSCLKTNNGWGIIEGNEAECLYRKRNNHKCFYALLLPVPKFREKYGNLNNNINRLTIELLFSDETLKKIDCYKEENIGCGAILTKIKGEKRVFWKKLFELAKEDFKGFEPLFNKIKFFFELEQ